MRRPLHRRAKTGFTLIETIIATAMGGVIIGAFLVSATTLQRSFSATQAYSASKRDQMRLTDYLTLDLRRALTVVAPTTGNEILSITIPDFYEEDGTPRTPVINRLVADYGIPPLPPETRVMPVTVIYSRQGSSVYRQEGSKPITEIAVNVQDFQITVQDLNKVIKTRVSFVPKFQPTTGAAARETTTLHSTIWLRNKRRGQETQ